MWLASTSVMVAVVQCASRVGGSPRLPTLRTPPFFWATASDALPATSAVDTSANSTARTISLDMLHLPVVGEPNLSHARRPAVGQVIRVPASRPPLLQPEPHVHLAVHRRGGGEVLASLLQHSRAAVELPEAEVAVADEGTHSQLYGQHQPFAIASLGFL